MMNLSVVLSSLKTLEGQHISVDGFLHSDTVNVWLNEQPRSETEQLVVDDPRIAELLLSTFPPFLGGAFAYCLESSMEGVLRFDQERNVPVLSAIKSVVVDWKGVQSRLL